MPATRAVKIKHRLTGAILFAAEVEIGLNAERELGAAVKAAVKAGAYLSGAYLSRADLSGANLSGAYLSRADLSGANLADANLSDANLSDANLSDANLSDANLSRAYLSGANLADANLSGANLSGANLSGANLADAKDLLDAGTPHGYRVVVNVYGGAVRIWAGCRSFTLAKARAHWAAREDRKLMPALLDYIERMAVVQGWKVEV